MEKVKEMMEKKMTSGKQLETIVYPQTNHTIVYLDVVFFCGRHLEHFMISWKFHSWKIKSKRKKLKNEKKHHTHTKILGK